MQFLQAWAESLTLFKPVNLKPFLLITFKSIVDTYKVLFIKFWPIVLICLVFDFGGYYLLTQTAGNEFQAATVSLWLVIFSAAMIALMALCMTILLAARPSVALKSWQYLFGYWRHFLSFFFAWFVAMICRHLLLIVFIYWIFFACFLLDSDGRFKSVGLSLWRALKIMFYNLPFAVISSFVFSVLFLPMTLLIGGHIASLSPVSFIVRFCLVNLIQFPLLICFYMNFYIKQIREQFNLYFAMKGQ